MTQLSDYMRQKVKLQLTASNMWMASLQDTVAPCQLCPPKHRITTRTRLEGNITGPTRGTPEYVMVCYKCIGKLYLLREMHQQYAERRVYGKVGKR